MYTNTIMENYKARQKGEKKQEPSSLERRKDCVLCAEVAGWVEPEGKMSLL